MAGISPIASASSAPLNANRAALHNPAAAAAGQQYAGDNVYALSTSSAAAILVANPLARLVSEATDAVSAVSPVLGSRVDRLA